MLRPAAATLDGARGNNFGDYSDGRDDREHGNTVDIGCADGYEVINQSAT